MLRPAGCGPHRLSTRPGLDDLPESRPAAASSAAVVLGTACKRVIARFSDTGWARGRATTRGTARMQGTAEAEDEPVTRRLLLDDGNQSVRIRTLEPGEETAWHWHERVTDNFIATAGGMVVDTRDDRVGSALGRGCFRAVAPKVRHRVRNVGKRSATLVTVQTGGRRDFNLADDAFDR